jgi:hypothetical protein
LVEIGYQTVTKFATTRQNRGFSLPESEINYSGIDALSLLDIFIIKRLFLPFVALTCL